MLWDFSGQCYSGAARSSMHCQIDCHGAKMMSRKIHGIWKLTRQFNFVHHIWWHSVRGVDFRVTRWSATVWDSLLGPTWLVGCSPAAFSLVTTFGLRHPSKNKKKKERHDGTSRAALLSTPHTAPYSIYTLSLSHTHTYSFSHTHTHTHHTMESESVHCIIYV